MTQYIPIPSRSTAGEGQEALIRVTENAQHVWLGSGIAGEQNPSSSTNAWLRTREDWNYTVIDLSIDAANAVSAGVPAVLGGIWVDVVMSAHACPVLDNATTIFNLPASSAAGTALTWCRGMRFETALVVNSNDAATGTIVVMWRPL